MSDFDLSKLAPLLARLDETLPASGLPFTDHWQQERREAAAAIRALMAENSILIAAHDAQAFDIANAVDAEREACAKVCEESFANNRWNVMTQRFEPDSVAVSCAAAIRARGDA